LQPDQIYAARLAAIRKAQHIIQFETFFMTPGARANEFAEALIERSHNGVHVQCQIIGTAIPKSEIQRFGLIAKSG
jgi:cardiolipin synthase A/B